MKKTYIVKRTLRQTPKGVKAYYFQDGKRIPDAKGRLKWIKQNQKEIDKPYAKEQPILTNKEKSTLNRKRGQANIYRYKGRPVNKLMTEFMKARGLLPKIDPQRDITKIVDAKGKPLYRNFGLFEQAYEKAKKESIRTTFESLLGLEGYRGRTDYESAVSIAEGLKMIGYDGWNIEVETLEGFIIRGYQNALEAIKDFEIEEAERLLKEAGKLKRSIAAISFTYTFEWDFEKKIVFIALWDTNRNKTGDIVEGGMVLIQEKTSDPIKRTS